NLPRWGPQTPLPRFWVRASTASARRDAKGPWLLVRALTNPTNERTLVPALVPPAAVGNSALIVDTQSDDPNAALLLAANIGAVVLDDVARQKMGNTNVNMFHLRQLPLLPPHAFDASVCAGGRSARTLICERVSLLNSRNPDVARLLETNAHTPLDDDARRIALAEIDALFAHLYGFDASQLERLFAPANGTRSFDVLERNERRKMGCFATRDTVLTAFDTLWSWAK